MTRPRAAIVVTGSELVRGERSDANGPYLARELMSLGVEPEHVTIVGDGAADLRAAVESALRADLVVTSGGLGPTHDDRTVEVVAAVAGRSLRVEEPLLAEIEAVSRRIAERLRRPYADFEEGVRKQASVPDGAEVVGLAGTAPGLVLEHEGSVIVVLPGPPSELRRLWAAARDISRVRRLLDRAVPPVQRRLRLFGVSESAVAQALAEAGGDGDGVEATICARDYEIHVDLFSDASATGRGEELADRLAERLSRYVFARDEQSVEALVLAACRARGWTLATAESCTGGLVAARLTEVPGASEAFLGGVTAYADSVKSGELDVPETLLAEHGAVSGEVAEAMAHGVRRRLGADVGLAVTGVAGPAGGTPEKPVGLVHAHAATPTGERGLRLQLHGDRAEIRRRAAVTALHLVRRLLEGDGVTLPARASSTSV